MIFCAHCFCDSTALGDRVCCKCKASYEALTRQKEMLRRGQPTSDADEIERLKPLVSLDEWLQAWRLGRRAVVVELHRVLMQRGGQSDSASVPPPFER